VRTKWDSVRALLDLAGPVQAYRLPTEERTQSEEGLMPLTNSRKTTKRDAAENARGFGWRSVPVSVQIVEADGIRLFYRAAGDPSARSSPAARIPSFVVHVPQTNSTSRGGVIRRRLAI